MTDKASIAMFVITCVLVFAVMANGYRPLHDALVYMIPALDYTQVPHYEVYKTAEDNQ